MSNYPPPPAPQGVSGLGIASLVLGIVGLPLSMIPCVNFVGLPLVGIGLILGVIGIIVAKSGQQTGVGLPIAGSVVSLIGLVISLAWIGLMGYLAGDAQNRLVEGLNESLTKLAEEEKDIREGPATVITAADLFAEYDANELAADQKYKNKVLEVTGTIERVVVDGLKITVELMTDEAGETIDCEFSRSHKEELTKLARGQRVTIRGKCRGMTSGFVTLDKCILK